MTNVTAPGARPALEYDPFSARIVADPYDTYSALLALDGVYYNPRRDIYALPRYADIVEYGRDWRTFSYTQGADIDDIGEAYGPGNFLEHDPPLHTAMRGIVKKAFVPKVLRARLEHVIERETTELIDALVAHGEGDFAEDFAWVLPMRVVAELLDIPREDLPQLAAWDHDFHRRILGERIVPPLAVEASQKLRDYFGELLGDQRENPTDGLLSVIAQADVAEEHRQDTLASMAFLLWNGSIETTACLLGNAAVLLAEYETQRDWLRTRLDAIPAAVEEILRFETPLQVMRRTTTRPVDIRGVQIPTGASVLTVYGSANRDWRRFPDADSFDVTREPARHVAFGDGIHHCLGAPLARLEAQITIRTLLEKCPTYIVDTDHLERLSNYIVRGFVKVPVMMSGSS